MTLRKQFQLMLVLLLTAALLPRSADSQCVNSCGCLESFCCLVVQENQPPTDIGMDDSNTTQTLIRQVSNPVFSLGNSGLGSIFMINQDSGRISTRRPLDRENETFPQEQQGQGQDCFLVSIHISGQGGTTVNQFTVAVKVNDTNDNPPVFTMSEYTIEIEETTNAETIECNSGISQLMATDADIGENAEVTYEVISPTTVEGMPIFVIDQNAQVMPCIVNGPGIELDRDSPPSNYTFTLVARNEGSSSMESEATVTYILTDINDNEPVFENETYSLLIREDLPPMSEIYQFRAMDADLGTNGGTDLIYRINDISGRFTVNQTTGHLLLMSSLDANSDSDFTLTVTATDMGTPPLSGSAEVTISVMDVNEKVSFIYVDDPVSEIPENGITTGIALIMLADPDFDGATNMLNTLMVIGDLFEVTDAFAGNFFLNQIKEIDYEENTTYQIQLRTTEPGVPVIHQIFLHNLTILDLNDNPPGLSDVHFEFPEDVDASSNDHQIVDLSDYALDIDSSNNGRVGLYSLVSVSNETTDLTDEFASALNEMTGILTTGSIQLDREVLGNTLNFMVNLTDLGSPPLSQVVDFTVTLVDINDNSPMFVMPNYTFYFREDQPLSLLVGTVSAMDPDYLENGTVFYSIVGNSQFRIHNRTGDITSGARFDRERVAEYQIRVQARDNASTPRVAEDIIVTVIIVDENDEDPKFNQTQYNFPVRTNDQPGTVIGTLNATDLDSYPNNQIMYRLEGISSLFSIQDDNITGAIILNTQLAATDEGTHYLTVSAFNPDREMFKDTVNVTITVVKGEVFTIEVIGGIAGGAAAFFLILIVIMIVMILCICHKNRKYKTSYDIKEVKLNNAQKTILKIPATNGQQPRSRVTFNESVQETHYNEQSVVIDTNNTIRKESITKFDNSPREHRPFPATIDEEDTPTPTDHHPPERMDVVELEMSPGHMINGDIPIPAHHHNYNMRQPRPHSPIVHVVNGGGREDTEFSQGTSSDGHTYMDDEESMFSDDASIVNTAISRYGNEHHDLDTQYGTPSTHPHLELHHHLPPMSHGQPTNSSLAQLHAHNLAQLAEANRHQQYGSLLNGTSDHSHSLTLTPHNHMDHTTISTQSTHSRSPPSPRHSRTHLGAVAERGSTTSNHLHSSTVGVGSGRKYPHPLVMPDAFPRDTTDIHRFPIGSYAEDYGEASTYASTELDEALGFNLDAEPGIISLTATTDYEEDTVL